ncbi:hypothetical protein A3D78_03050 [Candidatus Gottesmanbacteria bacterium RIFCSPHIGHO2_02_FULL_39_14]|uniref:Uncharacterized protein n=3 Tax=Candidatus Gottesmaniibacteriota TaxID=1752720 RepID=A0A1F6A2T0_9BACT|nr:MAG: hypothetical protein A2153_01520 [Candidatus Gottesmanbacteria bacterium RBG_16_38_7b]OGG18981.1 MAG: hypothetical protein A3D78_03050 [Candidatus Gottesmanbacteria bacterium RIFCSPHIGHO2_02_FULL_39_14]OGG32020.1 MAG: hypothetical protein A3I51_03310 [Candidatus Gottesmanbacteria bacterium RIFCSPLOWO2_02_FULL_38_8]
MTNLINKILSDRFIPVILLFSFIISLLLFSRIPNQTRTNILGAADPPTSNCQLNQCGFCQNCGHSTGVGLSCGPLSRCIKKADNYICQFDLNCF